MNWPAFFGLLAAFAGLLFAAYLLVLLTERLGLWGWWAGYIGFVLVAAVAVGRLTRRDFPRYRRRGDDE